MTTPLNFDSSTVPPQEAFTPIPTGWYQASITDSEMKPNSAQDGSYLNLEFTILDGEHAGRKVWARLNLQNKNPVASEIAYKQLSSICHAVGVMQVEESGQLHDKPLMIRVKLVPENAEKGYDASNDVKGYKAIEGAAVGAPAPSFAAPAPTPAPAAPAPAAPAAAPARKLVMTEKAGGATLEAFKADPAWTDELLVSEGYAVWQEVVPAAPAAPKAPAAPAAPKPAAPAAPAAAAGAAEDATPPWARPAATA